MFWRDEEQGLEGDSFAGVEDRWGWTEWFGGIEVDEMLRIDFGVRVCADELDALAGGHVVDEVSERARPSAEIGMGGRACDVSLETSFFMDE